MNVSANPLETANQSLQLFLSASLNADEIGLLLLGDDSNVVVRIGDRTVLLDPTWQDEEKIEVLKRCL